VVTALGYDPIWFGVIVVMLVEIALISPPDGTVLYVLQGMRKDGGPSPTSSPACCPSCSSTSS
jgi:C4-dicarboxylate transporter DctM subunit